MQALSVPPAHVAPCAASTRLPAATVSSGVSLARSGGAGTGIARRPNPAGLGLGDTDIRSGSVSSSHCLSFWESAGVRWKKGGKEGGGVRWKKGGKESGGKICPSAVTINAGFIGVERRVIGRRGKIATRGSVRVKADGTGEAATTTTTSENSTRVDRRDAGVTNSREGEAKGAGGGEGGPAWLKPGSEELPPWARNEGGASADEPFEVPFWAWLIASSLVAIAAVGSIFEYFNKNPIFGVVGPDSPLYAPILGVFALTGFPTAGFLWLKATQAANAIAERMDKEDEFSQR